MSESLRTARIHIAATPDDKRLYRRAAKAAGQSLSDWMRTRLRAAAENEGAAARRSAARTTEAAA